jgi:hypothetical protein
VLENVAFPVTATVLLKVALPVTATVLENVAFPVTTTVLENEVELTNVVLGVTVKTFPPIAVFVAVELPVITKAVTVLLDLNAWLAATTATFEVTFRVVPPMAVFVAVELPVIASAVTVLLDLNAWLAATTATFEDTFRVVPAIEVFAPTADTLALNVASPFETLLALMVMSAPLTTAFDDMVSGPDTDEFEPPRISVVTINELAANVPYS